MVAIIIVLVLAFALVALPMIWIERTIEKHAGERADIPYTGAEFARRALDAMKLTNVRVEVTELGNHYDPEAKAVRLEPRLFNGHSLAAVTIAAHEVGHAMQDAMELPIFVRRQTLIRRTRIIAWIAQASLFAAPIMLILGRGPAFLVLNVIGFVGATLTSIAVQATTLPVEFDASFKRAMPLLEKGRFIEEQDMPKARELLRAAAYTYVAGLLRTLITIPILRR
ncbi:MAG: hypothetical protein RL291_357 [Pseudomonadota bacterium]